jgi:diaminopimelate decarboxylase
MHEFQYKKNVLHCENIGISKIAKKIGTPFYLYSYKTLIDHFHKLKEAFREIDPLICFSMKSNSNLSVLRALLNEGAGFDIVSGGELYKAMKIKADPKRIVYASVGKSEEEIEKAIRRNILLFNVESIPELILINSIAGRLNRRVDVAIRINPDVKPKTHKHITTGTKQTKFGLDFESTEDVFDNSNRYPNLNIIGLHIHIGSQITESTPYIRALKKIKKFLDESRIDVKVLNIGGGLGIVYSKEKPQTAREFAKAVLPIVKKMGVKLILEPGRFIAGNSGILVMSVVYVKETPSRKFVIVDAGINDLIRPSLYGAYHNIQPVIRNDTAKKEIVDVVGPICETGDFFAKERRLPELRSGDLLAIMSTGAYGFSMVSNYNARRKPCEVMVINKDFHLVRERETYRDLIRGESIPQILR